MSQTELHQIADSSRTSHNVKSILKNFKKDEQEAITRIDSKGNKIVKGGNHKITFQSLTQEPIAVNQTMNKIQIDSDSSDSDCEIRLSNVNQNIQKMSEEQKNKNQKIQPLISNESNCCTLF
ncbi:unnamed protein product (macronuclear) [Paramecium tetraurelia]|uniref:Uncharacterized protein n=1 Tax=Paramecium tetraurelia TaxID=5888 RepID=A0CFD8_PARTE|nr:uncharacterized protein GSPATT00037944001 [Paramecium tetraurelia]CAK69505.1 unnamed protein product [Paramecium tetraurelia]|eukprot:XP_001436902.1 hypothetical protein (macronuclear) [Paramecium tetraurelia strain d4-2]